MKTGPAICRHKMVISYDGTAYVGWQRQAHGDTVQERIETALRSMCGCPITIYASSRTDQGVHAKRQTIHCDLPVSAPACSSIQKGLNAILPPDIRITSVQKTNADFHARFGTKGKEYRYYIWNGPILPPDRRLYWTWARRPLDVRAMQKAAKHLVGKHDFAAFTASSDRQAGSTVRRIEFLRVRRKAREIVVRVKADGFLYRMVRSLVGFLLRVGEGALAPGAAKEILESQTRTARVPTAPPQGLFLWQVHY